MRCRWTRTLAVVALLLAPGQLWAAIAVLVDNRAVRFPDVNPQMINGRVLVPLRGVMEEIGATVTWVPAQQMVVAVRGDTTVDLRIGDRRAQIDGRMVTLDVPAMMIAGRTMVPLRFLAEALGADVRWQQVTQTVFIETPAGDGPRDVPEQPPAPSGPSIRSFTHNGTDWLRAGSKIEVTMLGSERGAAQFNIPGLVDRVVMREVSPGRYTAEWTVPDEAGLTVSSAPVIGQLTVNGQPMLIQAGRTLQIDTVRPAIGAVTPAEDGRLSSRRPTITAIFSDAAGSGIEPANVHLSINGREVALAGAVVDNQLLYRPTDDLPLGRNEVLLTITDRAGNQSTRRWSFEVATAATVIRSFTHNAAGGLEPGDVLRVRLEAEPGGRARFSVGPVQDRAMSEAAAGVYEGEYTVRKGDDFRNALVTATFVARSGESYTVEASGQVATEPTAGALTVPTITSPREGQQVASPIVVQGTADPGARIRLRVDYRAKVLGLLNVSGTITEQEVQADDRGTWRSPSINLESTVAGRGSTYIITARTVGAADRLSDAATVNVTR